MNRSTPRPAVRFRLHPLAVALGCAGFVLGGAHADAAAPSAPATATWTVENCNDSGTGSLREAATLAHDGDTVDMTALTCGTITLTTGEILATANNITIEGPGTTSLFIDGNYAFRPLVHGGHGVMTVRNLSIWHGYGHSTGSSEAVGGGIASLATVSLDHVSVKYCQVATSGFGPARGGGVYAANLEARSSMIKYNDARTNDGFAEGGGVFTTGTAAFDYTTIGNNQAFANDPSKSYGGGVVAMGGGALRESTVSANEAGQVGGVIFIGGQSAIAQSTVSGNTATHSTLGAGVHVASASAVAVESSTITGNIERNPSNTRYGAGLHLGDGTVATVVSSIVSGNRLDDGTPLLWFSDIGGSSGSGVGGDHDLMTLSLLPVPSDTLFVLDPGLAPLTDNGGPTQTHALKSTSPALEAGSNPTGIAVDQRGTGYRRVIGARADIGAFEFDIDDLILADGFD